MRYEKKMLILSGDGRGVVLIEKSGLGVRFALRTFGLRGDGLKAGVITREDVYVRELPNTPDPSAVFYIDCEDIEGLHFAVFDSELRLYGTFGKRMWEANVMGLLERKLRPAPVQMPSLGALPPIAEPPKVLPLPDGTGIPQSRDALYGDEALAENDFYTHIDISSRMPEVDSFLDSPRILDGLAPTVKSHAGGDRRTSDNADSPEMRNIRTGNPSEPATPTEPLPPSNNETGPFSDPPFASGPDVPQGDTSRTGVSVGRGDGAETVPKADPTEEQYASNIDVANAESHEAPIDEKGEAEAPIEQAEIGAEAVNVQAPTAQTVAEVEAASAETPAASDGVETETPNSMASSAEVEAQAEEEEAVERAEHVEYAECAAAAETDVGNGGEDDMPWAYEARYLKSLSDRALTKRREYVEKVRPAEKVKHLRETGFFERCKADIEKLFASAPHDKELAELLPEIEWVKVEFDGNAVTVGKSNVFLCYAVAGLYEKVSPLGEEAQWLPKRRNAPTGKGYWLIFQDISTGEIINAC